MTVFCLVITTFHLLKKKFSLWFLAYVQWCFRDRVPTSCGIWIITKYLFKKLSTIFDGDVLFELLPLFPNVHDFSKMQGMDKKNDGHAWCKVITTNIKNSFGLNFRKMFCLGNFYCVQDDCENFVHSIFRNETFWCNESVHIPIIGQMQLISFASSLDANFVMFMDLLYCWL